MTKISQLSSIGDSLAVDDQFIIRDVSDVSTPNKSVTVSGITRALDLGTAAAPAIAFASDKNTGIYSPGADQVAISTNGTGRLFVGSSGAISIVDGVLDLSSAYPIRWGSGASAIYGSSGSGDLVFTVGSSERMRINGATGFLGIGTSSPNAVLTINSATDPRISFFPGDSTYSLRRSSTQMILDSNGGSVVTSEVATSLETRNGFVRVSTGSGAGTTERLRITAAGLVGIGTSLPRGLLSVSNNSVGSVVDSSLHLGFSSQDYYGFRIVNSNDPASEAAGSLKIQRGVISAWADAVTVNNAGRVGIGTTVPSELLMVNGATPVAALVRTSTASGNALIKFNADETNYAGIGLENSALVLRCSNSSTPTERARIDTSGRLLVGTSTSGGRVGATFQIAASGAGYLFEQRYAESNASGADVFLTKSRGSIASPTIVNSGDNISIIRFSGYDGSSYLETATIASAVDGTPGANDMPGRLVFSTTADGAASPTERVRIDSSGRVGIGTTTPASYTAGAVPVHVHGGANPSEFRLTTNTSGQASATDGAVLQLSGTTLALWNAENDAIVLGTNNGEAARIDSSKRFLVGTSSVTGVQHSAAAGTFDVDPRSQINGLSTPGALLIRTDFPGNESGSLLALAKSRGSGVNSNTIVADGDTLGEIGFFGADGTDIRSWGASIQCRVDGTPGANDMPGRLVFSTTADGAASPTERMRITSAGLVGIGTTAPALKLSVDGDVWFGNGAGAEIGRLFNDSAVLHLRASTNVTGLALGAAGLERIRIQSGGNVGIGDTAPDSTLTIKAPAATTPLRISGPSSEFARVDSSGRLLVGTSTGRGVGSSIQALTQVETTNYVAYSAVNNANDGGSIGLMLGKSRGTAVGSNTIVQNNDNLGDIYFAGADGTDLESVAARITCSVDGTPGANDMPGRLVFSTTADGAASPTERMRIKENGNVWIGNTADLTSSVNRLSIQGSRCIDAKSTGGATGTLATFWNNASTGDNEFLSFRTETSDTIRGTITYNRAGGVVAYNTTSDYRSKIISGNIEDTGTTIDAFKVYRGVMNGATIERPMLIAHEAQEVAPYCVTGQKDAEDDDGNPIYQQMDHQVLVPLLIAELQQLRIRVAALEAE